jgi:hypothetical protein
VSQSTSDIRIVPLPEGRDVLGEVLRLGAREMLARIIQAEVADWIDAHAQVTEPAGRRQVVRNGSHPGRDVLTGLGPLTVLQPRVLDRRSAGQLRDVHPQRPEDAEGESAEGQGDAPRDLPGGEPGGRDRGVGPVRGDLRGEVPEGDRVISKDRAMVMKFYDLPTEPCLHIRTTYPIESVFSTVRLRHSKTKGSGIRTYCLTMVFNLMESASRT